MVLTKFGMRFDAIRTREDGSVKPAPDQLLSICKELGVPPSQTWMVGDYKFDLECGRNAGAKTMLMVGGDEIPEYTRRSPCAVGRGSRISCCVATPTSP